MLLFILLCSPSVFAQEIPVRIADGRQVTLGTTTDAAVSGDSGGTMSAKLRQLNKIISLVWDSGNNRINVTIGGTAAVTQSGTWNIDSITNPVAVTGAFWQATQPVSDTITANAGSGTFTVSGTVTANAGTNLNTSALATSANQTNKSQFARLTDGTDDALVSGAGSLQVTCDNCGAPSSFADNSAFTFGTTGITNIGAVVDDTATNTVAENSAGNPRMTAQRGLHTNLRTNAGVEVPFPAALGANGGLKIEGVASGTAVPVSGTFFQATQPVSASSLPLPTGAASAALQTQPGVDIGDVTVNNAAGASAVNIQDGGNSITVDGPLTDVQLRATTVPVSGTVTANAGSGTMAVSGPATDAQLRATPLPISGTVTVSSAPTTAVTGPLTDTQLRASAVPISGTITANAGSGTFNIQSNAAVNIAQLGGTNQVTGGLAGSQSIGGTGANNAAITQNPILIGGEVIAEGTQPAAATGGNLRRQLFSVEGVQYVQEGNSNRFSCFVTAVTVMTQCRAAPAAGLRNYITSVTISNQAATAVTVDVVYGTGANCATSPIALTHKFQFGTLATTTNSFVVTAEFPTPLVPVAATAICLRPSAATAYGATLTGFVAP